MNKYDDEKLNKLAEKYGHKPLLIFSLLCILAIAFIITSPLWWVFGSGVLFFKVLVTSLVCLAVNTILFHIVRASYKRGIIKILEGKTENK